MSEEKWIIVLDGAEVDKYYDQNLGSYRASVITELSPVVDKNPDETSALETIFQPEQLVSESNNWIDTANGQFNETENAKGTLYSLLFNVCSIFCVHRINCVFLLIV